MYLPLVLVKHRKDENPSNLKLVILMILKRIVNGINVMGGSV
jgi:hypothetical protein